MQPVFKRKLFVLGGAARTADAKKNGVVYHWTARDDRFDELCFFVALFFFFLSFSSFPSFFRPLRSNFRILDVT